MSAVAVTDTDSVATAMQTSAFSLKAIAVGLLPLMREHGGSIVSLDFDGQVAWPVYDWMGVAKAGLEAVTRYLARDLGSMGIRVNTIAPSLFATGLTAGIPKEFEDKLTADAAFPKRMGRPEEYARLAVAIIENPMLNGGTIRLDGGQHFAPQ